MGRIWGSWWLILIRCSPHYSLLVHIWTSVPFLDTYIANAKLLFPLSSCQVKENKLSFTRIHAHQSLRMELLPSKGTGCFTSTEFALLFYLVWCFFLQLWTAQLCSVCDRSWSSDKGLAISGLCCDSGANPPLFSPTESWTHSPCHNSVRGAARFVGPWVLVPCALPTWCCVPLFSWLFETLHTVWLIWLCTNLKSKITAHLFFQNRYWN